MRGPGALLGELSAVDGGPRSATVTALEPVTALVVPIAEFEAYLQAHGRVACLLMRQVIGRLRDADRKRIEFGAYDTIGRVAARLVELAERFGEPTDGRAADRAAALPGRAGRLDRSVPGGGQQGACARCVRRAGSRPAACT